MDIILSTIYTNRLDANIVKKELSNERFLNQTIRLAEINGVYFYFMQQLQEIGVDLHSQIGRFNSELQKLEHFKNTLQLLNQISEDVNVDYMLIKACSEVPHVPRDVDILVRECDKTKYYKAFEDCGMSCVHATDVETSFSKEGYLKIDIYTGVRYITIDFIDDVYLWNSYTTGETVGVIHPLLGNEANVLLMLVHSLYGHRSMTLLDFLHMDRILQNSDVLKCKKYAQENGWGDAFDVVLQKFNEIKESIISNKHATISFPYRFTPDFVLESISMIDNLNLGKKTMTYLYFSFIIDRIIHELKKSVIYDVLLNCQFVRNSFNSFNYFIRHACGDTNSK